MLRSADKLSAAPHADESQAPSLVPVATKNASPKRLFLSILCTCTALVLVQIWEHDEAKIVLQHGLFSDFECQHIVDVVKHANRWDQTEEVQGYLPTQDVQLDELPELANVSAAVQARVLPALRRAYGITSGHVDVQELYIVRYTPEAVSGLHMHVDKYTLSFSLALSEPKEYSSGGLAFDLYRTPLRASLGTAVFFPSKLLHSGLDVDRGTRYALVGLVSVGKDRTWSIGMRGPRRAQSNASSSSAAAASSYAATASSRISGLWASCAAVYESDEEHGTSETPLGGGAHCVGTTTALYRQLANRIELLWTAGGAFGKMRIALVVGVLLWNVV